MSKASHKQRPSRTHPKPPETPHHSRFKAPAGAAVAIIITAILAAVPFSLGKYLEFNQPDPFDGGAYAYSAWHILQGAKIGVDEIPSAQPGTLLVNILGVRLTGLNETGAKLVQTILQASALVLMFVAVRKLFGTLAAAIAVIIASTYLSAPLMAKYGNVKEQYMTAFMILGISCFAIRQSGGKWWWALLAGAFTVCGPLFKETGISAITAVGLFVIAQPLLKHRTWKQTGTDIILLLAGAVISIAPVYIWLNIENAPPTYYPYSFVWRAIVSTFEASHEDAVPESAEPQTDTNAVQNKPHKPGLLTKILPGYVLDSWQILKPKERTEAKLRVIRWYRLLILPIALAAGAIAARLVRIIMHKMGKLRPESKKNYDRFVLLFAIWWLLDMAFVWISPHSYEQYYLPLNASAAMLGGYLPALYRDKVTGTVYKTRWIITGIVALLLMIVMSWHIFFGIRKSPHTAADYGEKSRGYAQKLNEVSQHIKYPWEMVGEYMRDHSTPDDKIYVWGWVPGIYIKAQRFSPAPKAFEGTMHTLPPKTLEGRIGEILRSFEKQPPKFIVDTYKRHFPWNRPPLELWPRTRTGFLSPDKNTMDEYNTVYSELLREKIGADEVLRFEVMRPFREYVMKNYKIVRTFGEHVLFERKSPEKTE